MGKASRDKGARFERALATDLRAVLPHADVCRNQRQAEGTGQHGDVWVTVDGKPWPWLLEAKDHKSVNALHLWKPTAELRGWWAKACTEAAEMGLEPLLVVKLARGFAVAIVGPGRASINAVGTAHVLTGQQTTWASLGALGPGVECIPWDDFCKAVGRMLGGNGEAQGAEEGAT